MNILKQIWLSQFKDSLRKNASFLILSQIINAGFTFIFWALCAKLFSVDLVGLATTIISFSVLLATISGLGLSNTFIRHLSNHSFKRELFASGYILVLLASIIVFAGSVIYMASANGKLSVIIGSLFLATIFYMLIVLNTLMPLVDAVFIALRQSKLIFYKSCVINAPKLFLPILFAGLGFGLSGILSIYVLLIGLGLAYAIYKLKGLLPKTNSTKLDLSLLMPYKKFAIGNYTAGLLGVLPTTILPIIALTTLGSSQAAYLFVPMQFGLFLNFIASSTSQSMFSEASKNENNYNAQINNLKDAFISLYRLLIPASLAIIALGWPILSIYGANYATNGYITLVVFSAASIFVAMNWIGDTWLNIHKKIKLYFFMNFLNSVAIMTVTLLLASYGVQYIAFGWLAVQALTAMIYVVYFYKTLKIDNHLRR